MAIYINKGSKSGNKNYLVIKGSRVYTGEEFEADEKDIKVLKINFDVQPKNKKKSGANKPEKSSKENETDLSDGGIVYHSDEKDSVNDLGLFTNTKDNSIKGVK
jgi:protein tyrosine/serine phosphatase